MVIPPADIEDTLSPPPILTDSALLRSLAAPYDSASGRDTAPARRDSAPASRPGAVPRKDSAAASPKPDTAAAPPIRKPSPG